MLGFGHKTGTTAPEPSAELALLPDDVPVIMVSGDEVMAVEAKELLTDVECAVVKWGLGRNKAKCLSIPDAHEVIRETAQNAVSKSRAFNSFKPDIPATIQLTLYRSDMADDYASKPGVERVDARTVRKTIESLMDVKAW